MKARNVVSLLIGIPAIIALVMLCKPLINEEIYYGSDISVQNLPFRVFYAESLQRGELPLWSPYLFAGYQQHAEGQTGAAHPFHLLIYYFLPFWMAFYLEMIFPYVFAFLGMRQLLRIFTTNSLIIWVGATGFAFSAFTLAHFPHINMLAVFAHLPWLLWAIARLQQTSDRDLQMRFTLVFAALIASQILLGHPPAMYLSSLIWLAAIGYGVNTDTSFRRKCVYLGLGVVLGGLIGAIQLLPTLEFVRSGSRSHLTPDFVNMYSLHPLNLFQLVAPYIFAERTIPDFVVENSVIEFSIYPGIGFLILAIYGMILPAAHGSLIKRLRPWLIVVGIISLILMLGRYGGANQIFSHFPILNGFRCPSRYSAIMLLMGLGLALFAIHEIGNNRCHQTWLKRIWLVVTIVAALTHVLATLKIIPYGGNYRQIALSSGSVMIVLTSGAWWVFKPGNRWAFLLFLVCSLLEVFIFGYTAVIRDMPRIALSQLTEKLQKRTQSGHDSRLCALWNEGMVEGEWNLHGYAGITPIVKFHYHNPDYLRQLAVTRIKLGDAYQPVPDPLPRIRTASLLLPTDLDQLTESMEKYRQPLVMLPIPAPIDYGENAAVVTVNKDLPQYLDLTVKTPHPVAVVVADRWDANWQCQVNRQPVAILKAFDAIRSVILPAAGDYRIEFRYAPRSYRIGKTLTCIGGIIWLMTLIASYRRHRRAPSRPD